MAIQWQSGSAQIGALPTADATQEGKIFQYTGETNSSFTNGYFYECVEVLPATDPKTYKWQQKNVQDGGSGGTVAFNDITNRPLYDGQPMTSSTVIPYVSNSTVVASNSNTTYTMGGNVSGDIDMELSIDSSSNNVDLRVYDTVSQDVVASKTLGSADFRVDDTNKTVTTSNTTSHLTFDFSTPDKLSVVSAQPNTFYQERNIATEEYVDAITGDLTTLTTTDKTSLVKAINEVYEKSAEPFKVIQWTGDPNKTIPVCTQDIGNTQIDKLTFTTPTDLQADYQIVGMIAYEVFDAVSGGQRINCWPVCQFTGKNQTELGVRFMCAGTQAKQARRISAWVLLKHR